MMNMDKSQMVVAASTVVMLALGVIALAIKGWVKFTVDGSTSNGDGLWGKTSKTISDEKIALWSVRILGIIAVLLLLVRVYIDTMYPQTAHMNNYSIRLLALAGVCASAAALTFWFKFANKTTTVKVPDVTGNVKELKVKQSAGIGVYLMLSFGIIALSTACILAYKK
jgi:hypothetical protein